MLLQRALLHSIIALLSINVISAVATAAHEVGVLIVLGVIMTGHGLVFAASAGCAANNQRAGIVLIATIALLLLWPPTADHIVIVLLPIAAGVLVGAAVQRLIREATTTRRGHVRRSQPLPQQQSSGNDYGPAHPDSRPEQRQGILRGPDGRAFHD